MNNKFWKAIIVIGSSIGIIGIVGIGLYTNVIKLPFVVSTIEAQLTADFSKDRNLVGESDFVFVAKISDKLGEEDVYGIPVTLFEAKIIDNIKGHLTGTVTVAQVGGHQFGFLYIVANGDTLTQDNKKGDYFLQPGSTYILAASARTKENTYSVLPAYGAILISDDNSVSDINLRNLAESSPRFKQLLAAYPAENAPQIFSERDIVLNRFADLPQNEKTQVLTEIGRLGAKER